MKYNIGDLIFDNTIVEVIIGIKKVGKNNEKNRYHTLVLTGWVKPYYDVDDLVLNNWIKNGIKKIQRVKV